jgi:hypothetical protein
MRPTAGVRTVPWPSDPGSTGGLRRDELKRRWQEASMDHGSALLDGGRIARRAHAPDGGGKRGSFRASRGGALLSRSHKGRHTWRPDAPLRRGPPVGVRTGNHGRGLGQLGVSGAPWDLADRRRDWDYRIRRQRRSCGDRVRAGGLWRTSIHACSIISLALAGNAPYLFAVHVINSHV